MSTYETIKETRDVLKKTVAHLRKHGWIKDYFWTIDGAYNDEPGLLVARKAVRAGKKVPCCTLGALKIVSPNGNVRRRIERRIKTRTGAFSIDTWNDASSKEGVLTTLDGIVEDLNKELKAKKRTK